MRKLWWTLGLTIALGLGAAARAKADTESPTLEGQLVADAADGQLDHYTPAAALLIAGGIDDSDELRDDEHKLATLIEVLHRQWSEFDSPAKKARAIHEFMHSHILRSRYDTRCHALHTVLREGMYNCLSSTALFIVLADRFDLPVTAVCDARHVWCRVGAENGMVVETTCPSWFRLSPAERIACTARLRAGAQSTEQRALGPLELVAATYFNRGVVLLEQRHFQQAIAANLTARQIDPGNRPARDNLLSGLNAWALSLADQGEYRAALRILRLGTSIAPEFAPFRANDVFVRHAWLKSEAP